MLFSVLTNAVIFTMPWSASCSSVKKASVSGPFAGLAFVGAVASSKKIFVFIAFFLNRSPSCVPLFAACFANCVAGFCFAK